ncbi:MAG: isomerase [Desulfuromonas sp.]|nr:MAG: isomerase [Desulfuromonas sp.]
MKFSIYQVDAFTSELFSGNPAAVCPLKSWPDDAVLQQIAAENNLSETAFLVPAKDAIELRWFTPATEVTLCGHATLASAFVLFNRLSWGGDSINFRTRYSGELTVTRAGELLTLDFPALPATRTEPPAGLAAALGVEPQQVFSSREDLLVIVADEQSVRELKPDMAALGRLDCRGIIVSAPGERCDFVSRFFAPQVGIPEDPVTGSAHCVLTPYWAAALGKTELHARQISARGGELFCRLNGERVEMAGRGVLYLEGTITI